MTSAPGCLTVVSLPIGNLGDLTPRAASALQDADAVLAEDTRSLLKLASLTGLRLDPRRLHGLDHHHEAGRAPQAARWVSEGKQVALVSEAGTPGLSDPGARVVQAVREAGGRVSVAPGVSALTAALSLSGFEGPFAFLGFAPRKAGEWAGILATMPPALGLFFYESPQRLPHTLAALAGQQPPLHLTLFHELTKLHESVHEGSPQTLAAEVGDAPRGEWVLLLWPRSPRDEDQEKLAQAQAWLAALAAHLPTSQAVKLVAQQTGLPRNRLYELARQETRE